MSGSLLRRASLISLLGVVALGPADSLAASPSPPAAAPSASVTGSPRLACTNPEGGNCLGVLPAGTYSTQVFEVPIRYTVEDGWANWEDTPGNFLLVPPGQTLEGVNAGTSDFIGIYRDVVAPAQDCSSSPEPGVGTTAHELAEHVASLAGLEPTTPQPVTIGGLDGFMVDARVAPELTATCPFWPEPMVDLILGDGQTSFLEHLVWPGASTRLYYLDDAAGNIVIEVASVPTGLGWDPFLAAATPVVDALQFGAAGALPSPEPSVGGKGTY